MYLEKRLWRFLHGRKLALQKASKRLNKAPDDVCIALVCFALYCFALFGTAHHSQPGSNI